nr:thioredoxin family protein [Allomuricauda sp.]
MNIVYTIMVCLCAGMLQAQTWQANFDEAISLAQEQDRPIVVVFSGSDWCGPCIRFKKTILESEAFKSYASDHYLMYNADFPRKKKNQLPEEKLNSNKALFEAYNPKGYFPLVVVLDKDRRVLGATGYNRKLSPEDYINKLDGYVK